MVSETKLDSSFRQAQFRMEGYAPPLDMIETLMVVENGRKIQIKGENVVLYLWIYLKYLIVCIMIYYCKSFKLISSFLSNRKYRTKINSSFSEQKHLLIGLPQGSVLAPLLFNIQMCDLFLFMSESNVVNYADDATLYACEKNLHDLQRKLESESLILFEWFHDNYLQANSGKSHVMLTR